LGGNQLFVLEELLMLTTRLTFAAFIILAIVGYRLVAAVVETGRLPFARGILRARSQDDPELNAAVEQMERAAPKISLSGLARLGVLEAAAAGAVLLVPDYIGLALTGLIILASMGYRVVAAVVKTWRLRFARRILRARSQEDPELNAAVEQMERVAPKISLSGLALGALEAVAALAFLWSGSTEIISERNFIVPSRMFAGPHQYPPHEFKAYGILAFVTRPTDDNKDRFNMICDAYRQIIPHYKEVPAPPSDQMVTVWPIDGDGEADDINRIARDKVCALAVPHYGNGGAREPAHDQALRSHARAAHPGRGRED
jgi:hypothetical protein